MRGVRRAARSAPRSAPQEAEARGSTGSIGGDSIIGVIDGTVADSGSYCSSGVMSGAGVAAHPASASTIATDVDRERQLISRSRARR